MEARLKNCGEITVVSIAGRLEIERTQAFKEACKTQLAGQKLIFNLEKVNFVGSNGIVPFFEALQSLTNESEHGIKVVAVKPELKRILSHIETDKLQFHENEVEAITSFSTGNGQTPTEF